MRHERIAITLALLALTCGFLLASLNLSTVAGRFPLAVSAITVVLLCMQVYADRDATVRKANDELPTMISVFALVALLYTGGFLIGMTVFVAMYWRIRDGASWSSSAMAGAFACLFLYGGFTWLLGAPLYPGLLGAWLER